MKTTRYIFATLLVMLGFMTAGAAELSVNVATTNPILPPQVMYMLTNPGQYLTLSVTNKTSETQYFYFGVELKQISPTQDIEIIVPGKTMPKTPFEVPGGGVRVMNAAEMRTMFNHVRMEDITMPSGLFDNVASSSFGNLPEGFYQLMIYAYKWDPSLSSEVLLNDPSVSKCTFTVCYSAQPPQWISPMSLNDFEDKNIATLSKEAPLLQWIAPTLGCASGVTNYTYDIKIVQQIPLQSIEEAIERNGVVYQAFNLAAPQCIIPMSYINNMSPHETYIAQITAKTNAAQEGSIGYVNIQNDGKSDLKMFRVKSYAEMPEIPVPQDTIPKDDEKNDSIWGFDFNMTDNLSDSLYNFTNPEILLPVYSSSEGARKEFVGGDIALLWRRAWYAGGRGEKPDTIQFTYDVELFASEEYISREEMFNLKPVYESRGIKEYKDTIRWDDIEGKVKKGDYCLLRVTPKALNEKSIAYLNDSINTIDFAMCEHMSHRYFQCANQVEITSEKATKRKAKDLKDKIVTIGEYDLKLEEIKDDADTCITGTGHVKWEPFGLECWVAVKFDKICINDDDQVFKGIVEGCSGISEESMDVVKGLFSEWGIDNLIGDTGIPYANQLQEKTDGVVKNLAEKIDLSSYYKEVKLGQNIYDAIFKGGVQDLRLPIAVPKSMNPSPVDIQIATMKFAPTYATMDLIGEFQLPKSSYLKNEILVFGAPRLCISPNRFLPEGGTVSLLADFTLKDPDSKFDFTFKAPQDVIEPSDGCFVSWAGDSLDLLSAHIEMTIPKLKKVGTDGKAKDECPKVTLKGSVGDWNDWILAGTMDTFEAEDLPGYKFTADNIIYDHSELRNEAGINFPAEYDKTKAGIQGAGGEVAWQGVYIKEVSMAFPKSIKVGNSGESMKFALQNMLVDQSGCTLEAGMLNMINYKEKLGAFGSFKFSLDEACVTIIQDNFKGTYFKGQMQIPLLDGEIGYRCDIYNQKFVQGKDKDGKVKYSYDPTKKGFAYVFKVQQIDKLDFDFFLAELQIQKELTYFLLDAVEDTKGDIKTNYEFCLGGMVNIGAGAVGEKVQSVLNKLPTKPQIPNIMFTKMRIANNEKFDPYDVEGQDMQKARDKKIEEIDEKIASSGKVWAKDSVIIFGEGEDKIYFNYGQWGYASPSKKIGPFEFSISEFKFAKGMNGSNPYLGLTIGGKIEFCKGINIAADASFTIKANVKNISDISNLKLEYGGCDFEDAHIDFSVPAFSLKGTLKSGRNVEGVGEDGYGGELEADICYGLFKVNCEGGYFTHKEATDTFSWGYFKMSAGGKFGIPLGPVKLTRLGGGFYFNCKVDNKKEGAPIPQNGCIGINGGLGLATSDGELVNGDLDFTVVWDSKKERLTSFLFTGQVKAVAGMIDSKATLVYLHDDDNKYLKINITCDLKADGLASDILEDIESGVSVLQEFNDKAQAVVNDAKGGLTEALKDESNNTPNDSKSSKDLKNIAQKTGTTEGEATDESGSPIPTAGAHVALEIQITSKRDGKECKKWHVYLGEPDHDKRCKVTLINFDSKVISVDIGASAYLCVGNELPNNGELPPLPKRVADFLDGSTKGAGVKSDSKSDADAARGNAVASFLSNAEIDGGVMLGAHVWGAIKINLGLFYGEAGADAGFDISVVHLKAGSNCVNLGGRVPGYKGWYGRGQLYAYLYAAFGLNIDLGFFHKKISIIDCGIGGVFKAAFPSPNYFYGKARCKINLLGGLVKLDKTFKFNCGQKCELFAGNALDDYPLFDHISIGQESWDEAEKNPVKARQDFMFNPYIVTASPMNQAISVIDPTMQAHLEDSRNLMGDALELASTREFKFAPVYFKLYEYSSMDDAKREEGLAPEKRRLCQTYDIEGEFQDTKVSLTLPDLKTDKFYEIQAKGKAQEMLNNTWKDPEKWDSIKGKYIETPWDCTKSFYFVTDHTAFEMTDDNDLEPFTAMAYPCKMPVRNPSEGIKLRDESKTWERCIKQDIDYPMVMLNEDVERSSAYKKGTLEWLRYNQKGQIIYRSENKYVTMGDSLYYMMPKVWKATSVSGIQGKETYYTSGYDRERLVLRYSVTKYTGTAVSWENIGSYKVTGSNKTEVLGQYKKQYRGSNYRVEVLEFEKINETEDSDDSETSSVVTDVHRAAAKLGSSTATASTSQRRNPLSGSSTKSASTSQRRNPQTGSSSTTSTIINQDIFVSEGGSTGKRTNTYYVNVYKRTINPVYSTESKDLIDLYLQPLNYYGWRDYEGYTWSGSRQVEYIEPFIGIALDKIEYKARYGTEYNNTYISSGVWSYLKSIETTYGESTSKSKELAGCNVDYSRAYYTQFQRIPGGDEALVLYDPYTYFSWLANVAFISYANVKSSKDYLDLEIQVTRSLEIKSQYFDQYLKTKYSPYHWNTLLHTAYDFESAFLKPYSTTGTESNLKQTFIRWPLHRDETYGNIQGSSVQVSEKFIKPDFGRNTHADTYVVGVTRPYYLAEQLSSKINVDIWNMLNYMNTTDRRKAVREYYKVFGGTFTRTSTQFGKYGEYKMEVRVPRYQYPLTWAGTELKGVGKIRLENIIKSDDSFWRFRDDSNKSRGKKYTAKMFFSLYDPTHRSYDQAYKQVEWLKFNGQKALDRISYVRFRYFRINGFNKKKKSWTVVTIPHQDNMFMSIPSYTRATVKPLQFMTVTGLKINGTYSGYNF